MKLIRVRCPDCGKAFYTTAWALRYSKSYYCMKCQRMRNLELAIRDPDERRHGGMEYKYYCTECDAYYMEDGTDYDECPKCGSDKYERIVEESQEEGGDLDGEQETA